MGFDIRCGNWCCRDCGTSSHYFLPGCKERIRQHVFYSSASAMYESGEFNELVEYCHDHIKKKPKEAYAYWFLGKAHFQMKELDNAEEYFKKAVEIYPSWEKEWVKPFLEKIETERNSPLTNGSSGRS